MIMNNQICTIHLLNLNQSNFIKKKKILRIDGSNKKCRINSFLIISTLYMIKSYDIILFLYEISNHHSIGWTFTTFFEYVQNPIQLYLELNIQLKLIVCYLTQQMQLLCKYMLLFT